jgi:hypothetical protein
MTMARANPARERVPMMMTMTTRANTARVTVMMARTMMTMMLARTMMMMK